MIDNGTEMKAILSSVVVMATAVIYQWLHPKADMIIFMLFGSVLLAYGCTNMYFDRAQMRKNRTSWFVPYSTLRMLTLTILIITAGMIVQTLIVLPASPTVLWSMMLWDTVLSAIYVILVAVNILGHIFGKLVRITERNIDALNRPPQKK